MRYLAKIALLFTFLFTVSLYSVAQGRSENDIKKLIKKCKASDTRKLVLAKDKVSFWNAFAGGKEYSFKNDVSPELYNDVEKSLLSIFDDIIVHSNFTKCYFVRSDNKIGVCKFDGTLLVPPVSGVPRLLAGTSNKFVWIGDIIPWIDYQHYCESWVKDKRDIGVGEFKAVINKKTGELVIPYGVYDFISATATGYGGKFFVCKKIENDCYKWGLIDSEGNVEIPCEYSGISHMKGNAWVGDNSFDLYKRTINVRNRIADRVGKFDVDIWGAILSGLESLGNGIIKLDETLREYGTYDFINNMASSYNSDNYTPANTYRPKSSTETNKTENNMSLSDAQNYQSLRNTYNKWGDDLMQMKNANGKYQNGYSKADKEHAQSEMKRIRNAARSKFGKDIPKHSLEDW